MKDLLGKNSVQFILRALSTLVGLALLFLGLGFLIMPEIFATAMLVDPWRAVGINSLRADFGALFLGMSFFCLVGCLTEYRRLLLVPIVFLTLVAVGRVTGYIVDDLPKVTIGLLVSELIFLTVLGLTVLSEPTGAQREPRRPLRSLVFSARFWVVPGLVVIVAIGALLFTRQIAFRLWDGFARRTMAQDWISELPDGLHVGLAGTGSPLPTPRRKAACMFVLAGKRLFIVDSGPGSTLNLELMRVPLGRVDGVLLTHMHSDHIAGLGELFLKAWTGGGRSEPLRVLGPSGVETVVEGFNKAFMVDAGFRIAHHGPIVADPRGFGGEATIIRSFDRDGGAVVFEDDDLKVTAFLVSHSPAEPALGFRFDYRGRSLVISGDTMPSESMRHYSKGVDLLLHEALQPAMLRVLHRAALANGNQVGAKVFADIPSYHTSPEEAARIARDAGVRYLVLYHLIPPLPAAFFNPAFVGDAADYYEGPITVAADGMLFSMPPNSTEISRGWLLK